MLNEQSEYIRARDFKLFDLTLSYTLILLLELVQKIHPKLDAVLGKTFKRGDIFGFGRATS